MSIFDESFKYVIGVEGRYVNDPRDPGGATMFGIAFNYNQGILKEFGITSPDQMRSLPLETAKTIYERKYWKASGADLMKSPPLQYLHFDTAVNNGVGAAAKCAFAMKRNPKDFEGPPKNSELWEDMFFDYLAARLKLYTTDRNRKFYLEGWINRIAQVLKNASAL